MYFAILQPGSGKLFDSIYPGHLPLECESWVRANLITGICCFEMLSVTQSLAPNSSSLTLEKRFGPESPKLYELCLSGKPLGKGGDQATMLYLLQYAQNQVVACTKFMLRDAVIQSIQTQKTPDGRCLEVLQLGFSEVVWDLNTFDAPTPKTSIDHTGWSFTAKAAIASLSP